MVQYDYAAEIRAAERRVDWLKEAHIEAQQHGCFRVAETIAEDLNAAERDLEDLRNLR